MTTAASLSETQQRILISLAAVPDHPWGIPYCALDAPRRTPSERASFSRALARLERRGFLVRLRGNGRLLRMTAAGRELAGRLTSVRE